MLCYHKAMNSFVPLFGTPGWVSMSTAQKNVLLDPAQLYPSIEPHLSARADALYAVRIQLTSGCLYDQIPAKFAQMSAQSGKLLFESLKKELPGLIGDAVEKHVGKRLDTQQVEITTQITGAKDAMLAKKTVEVHTSIIGLGKITEAYTKTIEVLQSLGKAFGPSSNVDNTSFLGQLGRSATNGAKGAMKLSAGGLAAAAVMSVALAGAGIGVNKLNEAYPSSVPSTAKIASVIKAKAAESKVSLGVLEIEHRAVPTMTALEKATALLAQNGNDYGKAMDSVNTALTGSILDGKIEALEANRKLLEQLKAMHVAHTAQAPTIYVDAGAVAPTPSSGPTM